MQSRQKIGILGHDVGSVPSLGVKKSWEVQCGGRDMAACRILVIWICDPLFCQYKLLGYQFLVARAKASYSLLWGPMKLVLFLCFLF